MKPPSIRLLVSPRLVANILVVTILSVCASQPARSQCLDYSTFVHWVGGAYSNGWARDVDIAGNYAYVIAGFGLSVFDISSPVQPVLVGSSARIYSGGRCTVSGNYVYVAGGYGLDVVDISNPASPQIVEHIDEPSLGAVEVSGNYAYVTNGYGLKAFDITNPESPVFADSIAFWVDTDSVSYQDYTQNVKISANHAYVLGQNTLSIVDISNPPSMNQVGRMDGASNYNLGVNGSLAILISYDGLTVLDVSNPTSPAIKANLPLWYAAGIEFSGNTAFLAGFGLSVMDLTSPESPSLLGGVALPNFSYLNNGTQYLAGPIALSGGYAYVADGEVGLQVVDLSPLQFLPAATVVDTPGYARGLAVSGNYAFVADNADVQVIDISSPSSAQIVGSIGVETYALGVAVSGNYACVIERDRLQVLDVSTPTSPSWLANVPVANAQNVAISGHFAYVADESSGLVIIDLQDPMGPAVVVDTDFAQDVALSGNYAYVADGSKIKVVDVSTPSLAVVVGSLDLPGFPDHGFGTGIAVSGNYAYVNSEGLTVLDISNPQSPVLVGSHYTRLSEENVSFGDVAVSGRYAYITDLGGVTVMDITDATSPHVVGGTEGPYGSAVSPVVMGDHVYMVAGEAGLVIVPVQCEDHTQPVLITTFNAKAHDGSVLVSWTLWSDEPLNSFTLYRGTGMRDPIRVAEGSYNGTNSFVDKTVEPGKTYRYELVIRTLAGNDIRSQIATVNVPAFETTLGRSFPNPFSTKSSIDYTLGQRSRAVIAIYDAAGKLVKRLDDGERDAGKHRVVWDGRGAHGEPVGSGVYFYRLEGARGVKPGKMIRVK